MTEYHFTDDYDAGLFTGTGLHERLETEGKAELVLTIAGVDKRIFDDVKNPQWVLSFGAAEQELRVKPALGRPLFETFGNSSSAWIGRQIELSAEWIEWTDRQSGETKNGYTLRAKPLALNAYAAAAGGQLTSFKTALDDEIPF